MRSLDTGIDSAIYLNVHSLPYCTVPVSLQACRCTGVRRGHRADLLERLGSARGLHRECEDRQRVLSKLAKGHSLSTYGCWLVFCFFFCVPQLYLWGSPFGVRFLRMWPLFNPTIEVVTFRLRGWCMLGVFFLPVFTRLGHECQDLLSPCDGVHVCTD